MFASSCKGLGHLPFGNSGEREASYPSLASTASLCTHRLRRADSGGKIPSGTEWICRHASHAGGDAYP